MLLISPGGKTQKAGNRRAHRRLLAKFDVLTRNGQELPLQVSPWEAASFMPQPI